MKNMRAVNRGVAKKAPSASTGEKKPSISKMFEEALRTTQVDEFSEQWIEEDKPERKQIPEGDIMPNWAVNSEDGGTTTIMVNAESLNAIAEDMIKPDGKIGHTENLRPT